MPSQKRAAAAEPDKVDQLLAFADELHEASQLTSSRIATLADYNIDLLREATRRARQQADAARQKLDHAKAVAALRWPGESSSGGVKFK